MARRRLRARVNGVLRWGGACVVALTVATYCLGPNFNPSFHWHVGAAMAQGHYSRGIVFANVACSWTFRKLPNDFHLLHWSTAEPRWYWSMFNAQAQTMSAGSQLTLTFPLWCAGLLAAAASASAFWSGRRRRGAGGSQPCSSCNYDLSGLPPGSPCPECAAKA
jgi:hypothetical protein